MSGVGVGVGGVVKPASKTLNLQGSPPPEHEYVPIPNGSGTDSGAPALVLPAGGGGGGGGEGTGVISSLTPRSGGNNNRKRTGHSPVAATGLSSSALIHRIDIVSLVACFRRCAVPEWGRCAVVCKRWHLVLSSVDSVSCWTAALDSTEPAVWVRRSILLRVQHVTSTAAAVVAGTNRTTASLLSTPIGGGSQPPRSTAAMIRNIPISGGGGGGGGSGTGSYMTPPTPAAAGGLGSPSLRHSVAASFIDPSPLPAAVVIPVAASTTAQQSANPNNNKPNTAGAPVDSGFDDEDGDDDDAADSSAGGESSHPFVSLDFDAGLDAGSGGGRAAGSSGGAPIDVSAIIEQFRKTVKRRATTPQAGSSPASASAALRMIPSSAPCPHRTAFLRVRHQIEVALRTALTLLHEHTSAIKSRNRARALESDWWVFVSKISLCRRVSMWCVFALITAFVLLLALTHDKYVSVPLASPYREWVVVGVPLITCTLLLLGVLLYACRIHVRHGLYDYFAHPPTQRAAAAHVQSGAASGASESTWRWWLLWWYRSLLPLVGVGLTTSALLLTMKLAADSEQPSQSSPSTPSPTSSSLSFMQTLIPAAVAFGCLTLVLIGSHVSNTLYAMLPVLWFFGSPLRAMRDRRRTAITFLFALAGCACVFIGLKLDHRLSIAPATNTNESGWSIALIPVWAMSIPLTRLIFIYRRTAEEKQRDQWIYSVPIFFCLLLPAYAFFVLLTLQLDAIIAFPYVYLLLPLLAPAVAVPACQALLYCTLVRHNYDD